MVKYKFLSVIIISMLFCHEVNGQNNGSLTPSAGKAKKTFYKETNIPAFWETNNLASFSADEFLSWFPQYLKTGLDISFALINEDKDNLGYKHYRFVETYQGREIVGTRYTLHEFNNKVVSMNGLAFDEVKTSGQAVISENEALQLALDRIDATIYMWELAEEEALLKETTDDPEATYYPKGSLVWINSDLDFKSPVLRLAYKFNIYASEPVSRKIYYVDAETGDLIFAEPIIHTADTKGLANTKFSGVQTIITDSLAADSFRLRETGRGNGIETYNMQTGTSYGNSVDFYDDDNYWNNYDTAKDEVAGDAHWGAETTYDFYWNKFSRNSINNNGFKIKSYVHYRVNYSNAFWNGQVMTYGDGNSTSNPYLSLDIIGHEITHGLTTFTANLAYQSQSGAMNEGFSDIFGNMIEFYGKPAAFDWRMGENTGRVIRDMSNPNARGNPDTYKGLYWTNTEGCVPSSSNDNCGVHNNSGVLNYWFYLLTEGGDGTNDLNDVYHVDGLGKDKSSAIAFRCLTVYLFPSADYFDARTYSIQAAADLYGECSDEVTSVLQAWFAVGISDSTRTVDFAASNTISCVAPLLINFKNHSDAFESYLWDFGDGDTSTALNPTHLYSSYGTFSVSLKAMGNCGNDSIIKDDLIQIDSNLPCLFYISKSNSHDSVSLCRGKLYDDGGEDNYSGNLDAMMTISPTGATAVTLRFQSFAFEGDCDCDYLYIYDGPDDNSPLIGKYSGFDLPNGGVITSTGPNITIREVTDPAKTFSGFELDWFCSHPAPPYVNFEASTTFSCDGLVSFTSYVFNDPTGLSWDLGDGTISYEDNPVHEYAQSGTYTVKLVGTNQYGSDSLIKEDYIVISRPPQPGLDNQEHCGADSFTFSATPSGELYWYQALGSQYLLHVGDTFVTPMLTNTTAFYVQDVVVPPVKFTGLPDKDQNSGGNYKSGTFHALIFDCFKSVTLDSVTVYATGSGVRHVVLKDNTGSTLQDTFISIEDGEQRINLGFTIPIGNDLQLGCEAIANLFRNNGGVQYPIELPGIISITETTASLNGYKGYYYFFYNWEIQESVCQSSRKEITAIVNNAAPKADFTFSANEKEVSFNADTTEANYYFWDFGDGNTLKTTLSQVNHEYALDGDYSAKLKVHNACGEDSIVKNININTSVYDVVNNKIRIYPNPATDEIIVETGISASKNLFIKIVDYTGKEMISQAINKAGMNRIKIDVSELSAGLYLLFIIDDQFVYSRKLQVK